MSNQWLKLSGGLYLVGECFNRVEEVQTFLIEGKKPLYNTSLMNGMKQIAVVKETVEEIEEMLKNGKS